MALNTQHPQYDAKAIADLQSAIDKLDRSTDLILNQTKILNEQKEFLHQHQTRTNSTVYVRKSSKKVVEIQHVTSLNEELAQEIRTKLQSQEKEVNQAIRATTSSLRLKLDKHDRRFDELNHSQGADQAPGLSITLAARGRNDQLLKCLLNTEQEILQLKLNQTYLKTFEHAISTDLQNDIGSEDQIQVVYDDVSTLYTEVGNVTEMLLMYEHGEQLTAILDDISKLKQEGHILSNQRIYNKVCALAYELNTLTELEDISSSHLHAIDKFHEVLNLVMAKASPAATSKLRITPVEISSLSSLHKHLGCADSQRQTGRNDMSSFQRQLQQTVTTSCRDSIHQYNTLLDNLKSNLDITESLLNDLDQVVGVTTANVEKMGDKNTTDQIQFIDAWTDQDS